MITLAILFFSLLSLFPLYVKRAYIKDTLTHTIHTMPYQARSYRPRRGKIKRHDIIYFYFRCRFS